MLNDRRPCALTQGDPSGSGPEITLRAWLQRDRAGVPPFFVLTDPDLLRRSARQLGWSVPIEAITPEQASQVFNRALPVVPLHAPVSAMFGQPNPATAASTIESIETAVRLVTEGSAAAVVTNPIAKHVLYEAGFAHPGHTEYLAALAARPGEAALHPVMMLWSRTLAVVPVTVHVPLRTVPERLTVELIVRTGRIVARELLERFDIPRPRLAVAGLNPHAGEAGALGREDEAVVVPAVAQLQAYGIDAKGPLPADTMFHARAR